ncbi:hypothetical protein OW738_25150, partial [Klebsiella pneumoniae]
LLNGYIRHSVYAHDTLLTPHQPREKNRCVKTRTGTIEPNYDNQPEHADLHRLTHLVHSQPDERAAETGQNFAAMGNEVHKLATTSELIDRPCP